MTNKIEHFWKKKSELIFWKREPKKIIKNKIFYEDGMLNASFNCLQKNGPLSIDKLCLELNVQGRTLATHLLNLQLSGMIKTKPGGIYDIA